MEEIIRNLGAVITALNSVTVCGKQNLTNLSGSIAVLEDVIAYLNRMPAENAE